MTRRRFTAIARALPAALLLSTILVPGAARAEDEATEDEATGYEEQSEYGPIQKRLFELDHELSVGWAYLPLDPFYKGYGVQVAYTIHFDELVALELFRFGWSHNIDSDLKTKLIEQMPDVSPTEVPGVVFFHNTNLLLKIFYGKQSLLNLAVMHFELFATAGVALLYLNPFNLKDAGDQQGTYDQHQKFEFGVNAGFGFRVWISPDWSLRVDMRDTVTLLSFTDEEFPLKNSAMIGVAIAVNL